MVHLDPMMWGLVEWLILGAVALALVVITLCVAVYEINQQIKSAHSLMNYRLATLETETRHLKSRLEEMEETANVTN